MPEDGKTSIGVILTKLCFVLIATLLPSSISLWLLSIVPFGLVQLKAQAFLLSGVFFFIGSSALIFSSPSKNKGLVWLSGFVISVGAVIVGGIIVLFQIAVLYPLETLVVAGIPMTIILLMYGQKVSSTTTEGPSIPQTVGITVSQRVMKKERLIGAVELTEFPEEHLLSKDLDRSKHQPFHNILRVMILADFPVALRYERVRNKMRVLYLTWAKTEVKLSQNLETLADTVKGNLRGFKRKVHPRFHGPTISPLTTPATTYLLGEPLTVDDDRQSMDVMNVMAEVLLGLSSGIIQFTAIPKRLGSRALKNLENQYRTESERAQLTISKPRSTILSGEIQESKTRTDMAAVKKAESLKIQIERLSNSHLCEVEVSATCWDRDPAIAERHSKKLMDVLRGTLVPADPQKHLTLEIRKNIHEAKRLIEGEAIGKTSLLSLDEASVYFSLARNDLGVPIADHASFITNPADLRPNQNQESEDTSSMKSEVLHLGQKLDDSGNPIGEFTIPIIDLASHTVVGGDTGTGKTITQSNLALELDRLHIPFLTIVASKHEDQLRLIRKIEGIRVFTPGDETTTPVRFSFSDFCEGMHVNSVINDTKAMFVATKPSQGIIKEYMEKVIELTYLRLGWDRETNTPGLPILFSDFSETLPLIKDEIQYSTRGNEDVWGALWGRYGSLNPSVLSSLFDTTSGMTVEELVSKPTILILDRLSLEEQMFLVYWLVTRIARYFEAKKKTDAHNQRGLKYVVFMEEAQRFFSGGTGVKVEEDHGVKFAAIEAITTTMKESRSSGLGFCLIAPNLSELTNNACNMALNIAMHRKGPKNDRTQIGDQMNCTDDQIRLIGSLPIGEAVVRTASIGKPLRVRINNPVEKYPELASSKPVTDMEVKEFMKPIYDQHPEFETKSGYSVKVQKDDQSPLVTSVRIEIEKLHRLYSIMGKPSVKGALSGLQDAAESGNALLGALVFRNFVSIVESDESNLPFYCHHLLWLLSQSETPLSEENLERITAELERLVSLKNLAQVDFSHIHERIMVTVERGLVSYKEDKTALKPELNEAVARAIEEMKEIQNKDAEKKLSESEHRLNKLVEGIVRTEQFTTRHTERFQQALEGDLKPIVRMMTVFARKVAGPEDDVCHVATLLLHHARSHLGSPNNDALWKTIQDEVHSNTDGTGSKVAI